MEEEDTQVIKPLKYLEKIDQIKLESDELITMKGALKEKLSILRMPLASIMQRNDEHNTEITNHWREHGDTYDGIPVLSSSVPGFQKSFGEYIMIQEQEKMILVKALIEAFEKADKFKINGKFQEQLRLKKQEKIDELKKQLEEPKEEKHSEIPIEKTEDKIVETPPETKESPKIDVVPEEEKPQEEEHYEGIGEYFEDE